MLRRLGSRLKSSLRGVAGSILDRAGLRRLAGANSGATAVIAAMLMPVLIFVLGFAIDIGRAQAVHIAMNDAADAAVLAAVATSSANSVSGGYTNTTALQAIGAKVWAANTANIQGGSNNVYNLTVNTTGTTTTAGISYTVYVPTFFAAVLGIPSIKVTDLAFSTATPPSYIDFYFLLDVSQSMGLGSTQADITKLQGLTGGCAFGCHISNTSNPMSNYAIARANGVTMRIDSVKSAVLQTLSDAQSSESVSNQYRFALYTMAEYGALGTLQALTSDLTAATAQANTIDLGGVQTWGDGQSYYSTTIPAMNALIANPGNGATPATAQKFFFLISDGVEDEYVPTAWDGHQTGPITPSLCQTLKSRGITVAVIYTTYLAMPAEVTYQDLVQSFASSIATNMQSCASPGYYYEASDGPGISSALQTLFAKARGAGRLTY